MTVYTVHIYSLGCLLMCYLEKCYGKCSKIQSTFLFLFSNKMLVFRAGIHKMRVNIANREDPDQSDLGLHSFPIYAFLAGI